MKPGRRYLASMPVLVVGADTAIGRALVAGLREPDREVRAFVTDPTAAAELRGLGVKVALGDVSDDSHIEGAAIGCFTVVLVVEAAEDPRERSFASGPEEVLAGWARAVTACGVTRVIWVGDRETASADVDESAHVSPSDPDLVRRVVALDAARTIG